MKQILNYLNEMNKLEEADQFGTHEYDVYAANAYNVMSSVQRETLKQLLFKGPVYDGDIISKSARDDLFTLKLAVRCCFKGEQGFTVASYLAYTIYRAAERVQMKAFF